MRVQCPNASADSVHEYAPGDDVTVNWHFTPVVSAAHLILSPVTQYVCKIWEVQRKRTVVPSKHLSEMTCNLFSVFLSSWMKNNIEDLDLFKTTYLVNGGAVAQLARAAYHESGDLCSIPT